MVFSEPQKNHSVGVAKLVKEAFGDAVNIIKLVDELVPTSNRKAEYRRLAKLIISNPDTTYASLKAKGKVKLSDANFYKLRRFIRTKLGLSNMAQSSSKSPPLTKAPVRKPGMFINIFEKKLNGRGGIGKETKDLLAEIFEALNQQKIANLQLVEVLSPERTLEVRSYAKV